MHAQIAQLVRQNSDLTLRQLFVLGECMDKGEQTVRALHQSGHPGLDKPSISRAVDRLVELGYVDRKDHPEDRRMVLVSLTAFGRKFLTALRKL